MQDFLSFETSPFEEKCVIVCDKYYLPAMKFEAEVMRRQLANLIYPERVPIKIIKCDHDFGPYLELRVYYDDANEKELALINKIDDNFPSYWNIGTYIKDVDVCGLLFYYDSIDKTKYPIIANTLVIWNKTKKLLIFTEEDVYTYKNLIDATFRQDDTKVLEYLNKHSINFWCLDLRNFE